MLYKLPQPLKVDLEDKTNLPCYLGIQRAQCEWCPGSDKGQQMRRVERLSAAPMGRAPDSTRQARAEPGEAGG